LELCRMHLHSATTDLSGLLDEHQQSALNRSCPQCRAGTLHVIAHSFAGQPVATTHMTSGARIDSS
jgi:hypothetical protein